MPPATIDVVGIGNAIVDVIAHADERFLADENLAKGAMTLIDAERAQALYAKMGPAIESSGGSAAQYDSRHRLARRQRRLYRQGARRHAGAGVPPRHHRFRHPFRHAARLSGPGTARCLILVTQDGQRTMATYLGACVELGPEDIDSGLIEAAQITYLEGYLFDPPRAQEAFRTAARIAHGAGRRVALSLSDPFCVARHRAAFRELVMGEVDILFANEAEICSLYETADFAQAAAAVRGHVDVAALTRSAHGSVVLGQGVDGQNEAHDVPAVPVDRVADTTGAGDLYAAGFLFGLTRGLKLPTCGALGSLCAAEIISHVGARPEASLSELVQAAGYV